MSSSLFHNFWRNLAACFRPRNVAWVAVAGLLTWVCVASGWDWAWFISMRNSAWYPWLFPAAIVGGLFPIFVPLGMLWVGKARRDARMIAAAWGTGQAAIIGLLVSSFYKFFTGRIQPPFTLTAATHVDISHAFQFGFGRHGIFWGWPSSHATVAFAAALTLVAYYPEKKWVAVAALAYAAYVAIGVSTGIHWLSDAIAGVIVGSMVGMAIKKRSRTLGGQTSG